MLSETVYKEEENVTRTRSTPVKKLFIGKYNNIINKLQNYFHSILFKVYVEIKGC